MRIMVGFFGMMLASTALAQSNEALSVDRMITKDIELSFPNDDDAKPKAGDFKIINYVLMSNEIGERWAVITLKNESSGTRVFDQEHLMALFADGTRKPPLDYKLNFQGEEIQTITVSFGEHKFPILTIYSNQ